VVIARYTRAMLISTVGGVLLGQRLSNLASISYLEWLDTVKRMGLHWSLRAKQVVCVALFSEHFMPQP